MTRRNSLWILDESLFISLLSRMWILTLFEDDYEWPHRFLDCCGKFWIDHCTLWGAKWEFLIRSIWWSILMIQSCGLQNGSCHLIAWIDAFSSIGILFRPQRCLLTGSIVRFRPISPTIICFFPFARRIVLLNPRCVLLEELALDEQSVQ